MPGEPVKYILLEPLTGKIGEESIAISPDGLSNYFNNAYSFVLILIAITAVFYLIYGGMVYVTTDIANKQKQGKEIIVRVITGLIFVFTVWIILNSINPNILNNKLNIAAMNAVGGVVNSGTTGTTPPNTGVVGGDVQTLAKQILELRNQGKISIADYSEGRGSDSADRSLASQQLADLADGKAANLSSRCTNNGSGAGRSTGADVNVLKFLVALGNTTNYSLNSLFGQCHSAGSRHYSGQAVDFGCPFNTSVGDSVGNQYGVSRLASEACGGAGNHYHYSVGGR